MTAEEFANIKLQFEKEQEEKRLQEEQKIKDSIVDSYPPVIPNNDAVVPVKGLLESERQDYSQTPLPKTTNDINFYLDVYKFLISFLSKTVILGIFLIALFATHPDINLETKGFIMSVYLAMTGTSLIKGQNEKKLEADKEIERIKVTPLNDEITNRIKSLLPSGGQG